MLLIYSGIFTKMETDISELKSQIKKQEEKLNLIYLSVEKTRKYFEVIMWISIIAIVLPIIGLLVEIPKFLNTYSSLNNF